ncbi:MAG: hypothetical protein FD143_3792, partial [Ignavibacteria bacterium]
IFQIEAKHTKINYPIPSVVGQSAF